MKNDFLPFCPRKLVSLADMIKFFAHDFIYRLHTLEHSQLRAREAIVTKLSTDPDQDFKEQLSEFLEKMRKYLIQLNLEVSLDRLGRFAHLIKGGSFGEDKCSWEVADREITELLNCILNESGSRHFAFIPSERAKYFEQEKLFGDDVYNNFESARPEIKNAGNCIAADLYSAAVFHLMRAAEHGLRTLALNDPVKIILPFPLEYAGWQDMIDKIEAHKKTFVAMTRGPAKDEELSFFQTALIECNYFKDLWRNPAMHTRLNPNEADAISVYIRTKDFMQNLSKRIKEI